MTESENLHFLVLQTDGLLASQLLSFHSPETGMISIQSSNSSLLLGSSGCQLVNPVGLSSAQDQPWPERQRKQNKRLIDFSKHKELRDHGPHEFENL